MNTSLPPGKLPPKLLDRLLQNIAQKDKRVLVGPKVGEDAAVIDMGDRFLVTATDPITFATQRIGWYAVQVNANDIAVKGAIPRWFQAVLLLPESQADEKMVETIFNDINKSCDSLNIELIGGHTEITPGLDRPLVIGQMMGEVTKDHFISMKHIKPGDDVLLAGRIAIEGTAIMATEKREELSKQFSAEMLDRASRFLFDPGISVVRPASIACKTAPIHGMHDPTEGGLMTALWEMVQACNFGLLIDGDCVPILPETRALCRYFGLNPLGLIASGALIIIVDPEHSDSLIKSLFKEKIHCSVIGSVTEKKHKCQIRIDGTMQPLTPFQRDEITKIL